MPWFLDCPKVDASLSLHPSFALICPVDGKLRHIWSTCLPSDPMLSLSGSSVSFSLHLKLIFLYFTLPESSLVSSLLTEMTVADTVRVLVSPSPWLDAPDLPPTTSKDLALNRDSPTYAMAVSSLAPPCLSSDALDDSL